MRIDHIQLAIPKASEDACRRFWIETLGFRELQKPAQLVARGGAWFGSGDAEVHLGVQDPFEPATKAHPAFVVKNLTELAETLQKMEYPVRWDHDIAGRHRFFTDDPVGNRIEFIGDT